MTSDVREERDREVVPVERLGVLENVFTVEGDPGREVVFVFAAGFADEGVCDQETLEGFEDDGAGVFTANGEPVSRFSGAGATLYPEGLLDLVRQ
ncbi:hypothetical protein [Haloarchaeobius sp. DT45]|uniref:hypothetical protein n=1 Tax=Haloarchaeobius sp. DT45 TaxID=3446116 RepID=UPI003F6C9D4C